MSVQTVGINYCKLMSFACQVNNQSAKVGSETAEIGSETLKKGSERWKKVTSTWKKVTSAWKTCSRKRRFIIGQSKQLKNIYVILQIIICEKSRLSNNLRQRPKQ